APLLHLRFDRPRCRARRAALDTAGFVFRRKHGIYYGFVGAVVISSRKQKNVGEAVEGLKAKGITGSAPSATSPTPSSRSTWLTRPSSNQMIISLQNFGHIDILVSANPSVDGILEMKESVLDKLWDINVMASILLLQDAAPHIWKGSSVIIISLIAGYNPVVLWPPRHRKHGEVALWAMAAPPLPSSTKKK
ncbi:hypothetical protein EJB05_01955, partial [Eragrostis curvula]